MEIIDNDIIFDIFINEVYIEVVDDDISMSCDFVIFNHES